ncbi:hypothetical protein HMPREF9440_00420 [Sutterella parvirubra YIT 11816]|uniref:Uncharacterized protein n=1 Tax=Sutterella parvirubra YIT 11816 TaxID=762967 RepID=H3KCG8_9BURK|nr:hypothetical protein HMPREF9440_00420 [Sutterella parvirubra YIT 11816]
MSPSNGPVDRFCFVRFPRACRRRGRGAPAGRTVFPARTFILLTRPTFGVARNLRSADHGSRLKGMELRPICNHP